MSLIFKDEVIYITGASAGIGFATAKLCMEQGATVVITGRNKENLKQAETELQKISSNVVAHNVDVSDESAILESLNEVHRLCGKIDGLVNNAPSIHTGRIVDLSLSAWKTNFKANLDAVFLTTKTVLPWMMAAKKAAERMKAKAVEGVEKEKKKETEKEKKKRKAANPIIYILCDDPTMCHFSHEIRRNGFTTVGRNRRTADIVVRGDLTIADEHVEFEYV